MTEQNILSTMPLNDTQKPAKARKAAPKPESTKHLRTLANGAVYDMDKKRIVSNPGGGTTAITSETASLMQARGIELKNQAIARAANRVAEQGGSVDGSEMRGPLAFVEAIGEAMTMKALSVNDPKAVDAARFILNEAGLGDKAVREPDRSNDPIAQALNSLIQHLIGRDVVDVTPIRSDLEAGEAE